MYVNNVERGQPEVYVVLEEAQIGVRIRESYALDIDRLQNYQESMGLLDVLLSVPPHYGVVCERCLYCCDRFGPPLNCINHHLRLHIILETNAS